MSRFLLPIGLGLSLVFGLVNVSNSIGGQGANRGSETMTIEIVTFKLKDGVTTAEFEPIDKAVQVQHVAKQPGFVARESARGDNGDWLVVVHWETAKDADASMATFMSAAAAQPFMSNVQVETMRMTRYTRRK